MDDDDDDLITVDALTKFAEQQTARELEQKAQTEAKNAADALNQQIETAEDRLQ